MPRTKQTAKKSTGGKVPHKNLESKASCHIVPKRKIGYVRHPRRFRPGSKYISILQLDITNNFLAIVLRETRHYQKTTNLLLPKLPFKQLVHKIAHEINKELPFCLTKYKQPLKPLPLKTPQTVNKTGTGVEACKALTPNRSG